MNIKTKTLLTLAVALLGCWLCYAESDSTLSNEDFSNYPMSPQVSGGSSGGSAYFYADFTNDSGSWTYVGNAYLHTNGYAVLTPAKTYQKGIIWLNSNISAPFQVSFRYLAGGGSGADGLALMFHKSRDYTPYEGTSLAFEGSGNYHGFGVEFDSYDSGSDDPSRNHIGIIRDSVYNHLNYTMDSRVSDGLWHNVSVRVTDFSIRVEVDGSPSMVWTGNTTTRYQGFGFSAATGLYTNNHFIDDVRIEFGEEEPPEDKSNLTLSAPEDENLERIASPGEILTYSFTVENHELFPLQVDARVKGLENLPYAFEPEVLLLAGEKKTLTLEIQVPDDPEFLGFYPFTVQVGGHGLEAYLEVGDLPRVSRILPGNNTVLSSPEAVFSWTSNVNTSDELYLKEANQSIYTMYPAGDGTLHRVAVNLSAGKTYLWYASTCTQYGCLESSVSTLKVKPAVSFDRRDYDFTVSRDYNQVNYVTVKNNDNTQHTVLLRAMNPFYGLVVGFIGEGSLDLNLTLAPGESRTVTFMVHAQDALDTSYSFPVNLTNLDDAGSSDYALVNVEVTRPDINFTVEEVYEDPGTLAKTYMITNYGDPLTDFKVAADDNLSQNAVIYPTVNHANLKSGESLYVDVNPTLYENFTSLSGDLTFSAAGHKTKQTVQFTLPDGGKVYLGRVNNPELCMTIRDWYCSNRPHIDIPFTIPSGFWVNENHPSTVTVKFNTTNDVGEVKEHDLTLSVNDNPLASLSKKIPEGSYAFLVDPSYVKPSDVGPSHNILTLDSTNHRGHYVIFADMKVCVCLDYFEGYVVAENEEEAEEKVLDLDFLSRPGDIDAEILTPLPGDKIIAGKPVTVEVRAEDGCSGGVLPVTLSFSNENDTFQLFDDGQNGDEVRGDGVYSGRVTASEVGDAYLSASSENCKNISVDTIPIEVEAQPDLSVSAEDIVFSNPAPAEGENLTVTATFSNTGRDLAQNVVLQLFGNDTLLISAYLDTLEAGQTHTLSANWTVKENRTGFAAVADPEDIIWEMYEDNNLAYRTLYIGGDPGDGEGSGGEDENGSDDDWQTDLPDLTVYGHEIIFTKIGGGN